MRLYPPAESQSTRLSDGVVGFWMWTNLGFLSLAPVAACMSMTRKHRLRHGDNAFTRGVKCVAYGNAVVFPFALHVRHVEQQVAARSSRPKDAAVPRTVFVDRLKHFDIDNAILFGGMAGAYLTALFRSKKPLVPGWRRHVAATAMTAASAAWIFKFNSATTKSTTTLDIEAGEMSEKVELASLADTVRSALDSARLKDTALIAEVAQPVSQIDGTSMAMSGLPKGINNGSSSSGVGRSHPGPPGMAGPLQIIADGPHIVLKQGNKAPELQAQTNYDWFSNDKIAELEQQITNLKAKRVEVAREAELLWSWLSEKEAELLEKYPLTKNIEKDEQHKRDPARESLVVASNALGNVHTALWAQAMKYDWIIADCQKRIAQEKSLATTGKVEWRPSCSEAALASPLTSSLSMIKESVESFAAFKAQAEQSISQMAMALGHPDTDMDEVMMHPMKNKMAPRREVAEDVRKHNKGQLDNIDTTLTVLKKVLAEGEQKARKGN